MALHQAGLKERLVEDNTDDKKTQTDKTHVETGQDLIQANNNSGIINTGRIGNVNTGSGTQISVEGSLIINPQPSKVAKRPQDYIPFSTYSLFKERPGEFATLEGYLFGKVQEDSGTHVELACRQSVMQPILGLIGMGGVGKTQLAVELAYRYREQGRFPGGIFWMTGTGERKDWQRELARLALATDYLPPDDKPGEAENELRRAHHFCRYLAEHEDALLVLDNVDQPEQLTEVLPVIAGLELECAVLYTSRSHLELAGVQLYRVEQLPENEALALLLEKTRPALWLELKNGQENEETQAAKTICKLVGCLPLALSHLRSYLVKSNATKISRLLEALRKRGALELSKKAVGHDPALEACFALSWEKIEGEEAGKAFWLAACFPEAAPIPLWLLGLAAGLGEETDPFEPLGEVCLHLEELSLLEELEQGQARLHPLVREFSLKLLELEGEKGAGVLESAIVQVVEEFDNLGNLQARAEKAGFWRCWEQVQVALLYVRRLAEQGWAFFRLELTGKMGRLEYIARRLERESYLLSQLEQESEQLPQLLYQQMYNRKVEEGDPPPLCAMQVPWLRQLAPVGAEDFALRRILTGHAADVTSVAFSPDGKVVLTGSNDATARLWDIGPGRLLTTFKGHSGWVRSVAFSPNSNQVLTGSDDNTACLWDIRSGQLMLTFEGHSSFVSGVAFSPDSKTIVTGSWDNTARVWDISSATTLIIFEGHSARVSSVVFSLDGKKVLTGSNDYTARLWDINSGVSLMTFKGHTSRVTSVAFTPNGEYVLTGSHDSTARLWELNSGRLLATFQGHRSAIRSVAVSSRWKYGSERFR